MLRHSQLPHHQGVTLTAKAQPHHKPPAGRSSHFPHPRAVTRRTQTTAGSMAHETGQPAGSTVLAQPTSSSRSSAGGAIWLPPLRSDEVWYLAYGSNMSPQVLKGRRRVQPQQSLPCYVPGFELSFGMRGFPWQEPGFATIQPQRPRTSQQQGQQHGGSEARTRGACLHGVLHRITRRDWAFVKASEGVVGQDGSGVGYEVRPHSYCMCVAAHAVHPRGLLICRWFCEPPSTSTSRI